MCTGDGASATCINCDSDATKCAACAEGYILISDACQGLYTVIARDIFEIGIIGV